MTFSLFQNSLLNLPIASARSELTLVAYVIIADVHTHTETNAGT